MAKTNQPDEPPRPPLEDLARAAYETAAGVTGRPDRDADHDSLVQAVLAMTDLRSRVRLPDPSDNAPARVQADRPSAPGLRTDSSELRDARETFSRYEIHGEIARGGMGVILKGRDRDLGREVAIKVLDKKHANNPALVERFIEEAQIGGQLQHPGIVPVIEVGRRPDRRPFFAMKLVKGRTLARLLADREDPAADRHTFLAIFEKVCQTLAYAHSRSVVHRDLKPANIMVGAFGEVQIMDWGLAKVLGSRSAEREEPASADQAMATVIETVRSTGDSSAHSHAGSVMGTPAYMPPEQARGQVDQVDERADVFALGAILCEILTGQPPYVGESFSEICQKAQVGELSEALGRLDRARVDPELVRLVRSCLAQRRGDRPDHAGAVTATFSAHLASVEERMRAAELNAARAETRAAAERKVRKRTVVAAVSVVAAIILIAGGVLWFEQDRRARQRRADRHVMAALETAIEAHDQVAASASEDPAGWSAVTLAADRARAMAADEDVDPALRGRTERFFGRVERESRAVREAFERRLKDRRMAETLDTIRTRLGDEYQFDHRLRDADYAAVFRDYGIDVDVLSRDEAAALIRASSITDKLVNALDLWAVSRKYMTSSPDARQRLIDLAVAVDPDPVRRKIRDALLTGDLAGLQTIARSPDLLRLPPEDVARVGNNLGWAGDRRGAVVLLRKACSLHPGDFWLQYLLGIWLVRVSPPQAEEAVVHASAAIALRPDCDAAWTLLGGAYKQARRTDEAIAALESALAIRPKAPFALANLGYLRERKGDSKGADEALQKALDLKAYRGGVLFYVGLVRNMRGDREGAIQAYQKAVQLQPEHAQAWCNLGAVHHDRGDYAKALELFETALEVNPNLVEALHNRAEALLKLGRVDEAQAVVENVLRRGVDVAQIYNVRGSILKQRGRVDEAVAAMQEAVRRAPGVAGYHNDLGSALAAAGRLDEALAAFDRAIAMDPDQALYHENRGNVLARRLDWPDALESFRRAAKLAPDQPGPHIKVGRVLEQLHRFEEAQAEYREALALCDAKSAVHREATRRIGQCQLWIERLALADAVLAGQAGPKPLDSGDWTGVASICSFVQRHAAAARLWKLAFERVPSLARGRNLVSAARAAARAGAGQGCDGDTLDAASRQGWLTQAVHWLETYLEGMNSILDQHGARERDRVRQSLQSIKNSPDLAVLRDPIRIASLPEDEQLACLAFWAELESLLVQCEKGK